jgi:hypothetical protein
MTYNINQFKADNPNNRPGNPGTMRPGGKPDEKKDDGKDETESA